MPIESYGSENSRCLLAFMSVVIFGACLSPVGIAAQDVTPDPRKMVHCFAASFAESEDKDECAGLAPGAISVLTHPDEHGAYLDDVMDGLADLAVAHPEFRVRAAAAIYLTAPGNRALAPRNASGVVDRIRRLYERSDERAVRSTLLRWMPNQAEEEAAVAFLETVARSERSPAGQMWPDEVLAIDALARMGEKGRAALRRLDAAGNIPNRLARQRLHDLRGRGYQLERARGESGRP